MLSYTKDELLKACEDGLKIYKLDTDNYGQDDILIGDLNQVIEDICYFHGFQSLPDNWLLIDITSNLAAYL